MSVDTPTLGWIGTGRMGHAMVRRLLDGGGPDEAAAFVDTLRTALDA